MKNKISRPIKKTRNYTKLFPKISIYREMDPKYIPCLGGQSIAGYSPEEREDLYWFLEDLREENGGTLPKISSIGSYSGEAKVCLVSFINEGEFSPAWFGEDDTSEDPCNWDEDNHDEPDFDFMEDSMDFYEG